MTKISDDYPRHYFLGRRRAGIFSGYIVAAPGAWPEFFDQPWERRWPSVQYFDEPALVDAGYRRVTVVEGWKHDEN